MSGGLRGPDPLLMTQRPLTAFPLLLRRVAGEDPVERAAGVGEHLLGLRLLRLGARVRQLEERHADLAHRAHQLPGALAHVALDGVPRGAELVAVRLDVGAALVGQRVRPAALSRLGADEPLVLELLQRRVDGTGARPPDAVGALFDLLHQLVAVARLLAEQHQQRRADVAAAGARAARRAEAGEAELLPAAAAAVRAAPARSAAAHREPAEQARVDGVTCMHRLSFFLFDSEAMRSRYIGTVLASS